MRYLVVADHSLGGKALIDAVDTHVREGAEIHVLVPATPGPEDNGQAAIAIQDATRRLGTELARLKAAGVRATGDVGDADPLAAARQAMQAQTYDGIILSTLPATISRWIHMDLPHRFEREFHVPIEWIESRTDDPNEETSINITLPRILTRHDTELPGNL